jgi:hypothetical protein
MEQLVDIRCPNEIPVKRGSDKLQVCNRRCVRVYPGSGGEAACPKCDHRFMFEVAKDNVDFYDILKSAKPETLARPARP